MTTWKIPEACADISESDIRRQDEEVLRLLLVDRTLTSHNGRWTNIKWCTGDYALSHPGVAGFSAEDEIQMDLISSSDGRDLKVVFDRKKKAKSNEPINEPLNETVNDTVNETVKNIVANLICKTPGIGSAALVSTVGKSRATVMRAVALLKQQGVIEHRGSDKTGGYFPTATAQKEAK